jgi:predicted transcriptional regulator
MATNSKLPTNILKLINEKPLKIKEVKEEIEEENVSQAKISGIIDAFHYFELIERNKRTDLEEVTNLGKIFLDSIQKGAKPSDIIKKGVEKK